MSLKHCKDTQRKCLSLRVNILKRCGSYIRVLLYIIKRSLAKLNIKHRMCCNKPIDYKILTTFSLDISVWLYGKEVMYQSIPSLTIPPGNFFDGRIPHSPGKKRVENPHPRAYKNELKRHPRGIFLNYSQ